MVNDYEVDLEQDILPKEAILWILKKICKKIKLQEEDIQEVLEKINQILNGKSYALIYDYMCQGDSDPFILLIQELLIFGGNENINSGAPVFVDEYKLLDTDEERKKYIMNIVEDICDGFNKNFYQEIKLIKINERYIILPLFEKLISLTLDNNDRFISERIKKIEYDKLEADILIESYPSLNLGYMDFTTDLAFLFILMELYPKDYENHYEINKTVFNFILFEILKEKEKQYRGE